MVATLFEAYSDSIFNAHSSRLGWATSQSQVIRKSHSVRPEWMSQQALDAPADGATHDLCIVIDATASMNTFLQALRQSLPQFIQMSRIIGCIGRVSVLVYRDYDCLPEDTTSFSGWNCSLKELGAFVSRQRATGGGDAPEAAKTAAHRVLKECSRPCTIFWYTDAAPHFDKVNSSEEHYEMEKNHLGCDGFDWINICRSFQAEKHRVFTFLPYSVKNRTLCFYATLAHFTNGNTIQMSRMGGTASEDIAKTSVAVYLALIGHESKFVANENSVTVQKPVNDMDVNNEHDCDGLLPGNTLKLLIMDSLTSASIAPITDKSDDLMSRFKHDAIFQTTVYDIFGQVITAENIIALTYNPIFGTLWRAMCAARNDPRREELVDRMGNVVSLLAENRKVTLKAFIEMSYDKSAEINDIISASVQLPAIVFDNASDVRMTRTELLEVSRSCHRSILARISTVFSRLRVICDPESIQEQTFIPLSANKLFCILPHLICAGTMFSGRPAAIMAILAYTAGTILKEQAAQHLNGVIGKWIDTELPENLSLEFCMLVLRAPEFLTHNELLLYQDLQRIGSLKLNGLTDLQVITGYTSNKTRRADVKHECEGCNQNRSVTLMTDSNLCVMCVTSEQEDYSHYIIEKNPRPDSSIWCECKTCLVHYVVVNPDLLNVIPKCHFCREQNTKPHTVTCSTCKNYFLRQYKPQESAAGNYVCQPCLIDGAKTVSSTTTVIAYLQENGADCLGMKIDDLQKFFNCKSLYTAKDHVKMTNVDHVAATFEGKVVHNHEDVLSTIKKWMGLGCSELGTCMLCFEEMPKTQLYRMCGKGRCDTKACGKCLKTWYGTVKPGQICFVTNLLCPMCKAKPSTKTLHRYNRELLTLKHTSLNELDAHWYYAWCGSCYYLKPAMEKSCTEEVPALVAFKCEDCVKIDIDRADTVTTQDCPGCSTAIHKTSGCNHIKCTCGTHFCYVCRYKAETSTDIYDHMSTAHGGFFSHDDDNGINYDIDDYESDYDGDY